MKIWHFSDMHLEYKDWSAPLPIPVADVCVVAGDLTRGLAKGVCWLGERIAPWIPTIYVPGNHEFYNSSVKEGLAEGREAARAYPGLHLLSDDTCVIDGTRFIGSTLWTDYRILGHRDLAMGRCREVMNDHKKISLQKQPVWQRFTPQAAERLHLRSRAFIEAELVKDFDGPTVVVTHHAPHPLSIVEKHRSDLVTAAYVSDLSEIMEAGKPDLWLHGHNHETFDYVVGPTRVRANPRGYDDENAAFEPSKVIEV